MINLIGYDVLIVGAGFCGSVIARRMAEEQGKRVLILERRGHIAGNMYDERDSSGILVQRYGPHIFHTSNEEVYRFVTRFGIWDPYELHCMAELDGTLVETPFNFSSIEKLYPPEEAKAIIKRLQALYPGISSIPVLELLKSKDELVRGYADLLFRLDYRPYTAKQWGIPPEEIDPSVLGRVPVNLSYDSRYFTDAWQCSPRDGYHVMFQELLSHPLITVQTGEDALEQLSVLDGEMLWGDEKMPLPVVYTGAIDELFGYRFGRLPYRSLRFEYQNLAMESFQPAAVIAYPQAEGYTRITEYKKLPEQQVEGETIIAREFPIPVRPDEYVEPYYPIPTNDSEAAYQQYQRAAQAVPGLYMCGRLANYRYYNMDKAIEKAFEIYNEIK